MRRMRFLSKRRKGTQPYPCPGLPLQPAHDHGEVVLELGGRRFVGAPLPEPNESPEVWKDTRQDVVRPDENDDPGWTQRNHPVKVPDGVKRQISTYAEVD